LRLFGYTRRGKRLPKARQYLRGKKLNLLSAISYNLGLAAYRITDENTTATDFNDFILEQVLPLVPIGGAIILDNASFHKSIELQAAVESQGRFLIFLPAYSPIFNPIELSYGFIKSELRRLRAQVRYTNLVPALEQALHEITPAYVQSWFTKCMYF